MHAGVVIASSIVLVLALVPALRRPAEALGLIDHPCQRKRHGMPIPLTGGLAMFLGFCLPLMFLTEHFLALWPLVLGMSLMLAVGLYDDIRDLSAWRKLTVQLAVAAIVVIWGGAEVRTLGNLFGFGVMGLGIFAIPLSILAVAFMVNAINMADGADGLAGGMAAVIFALLAAVGWLDGSAPELFLACTLLAAVSVGFLTFNMRSPFRRKASAFMGDAGSMMLGFAIAYLAIRLAMDKGASVYPATIAWILMIPAMDTFSLFVRRLRMGRSPFSPDRWHLHHILMRIGFSVRGTNAIIHLMVLITGSIGIAGWWLGVPQWMLFYSAAFIIIAHHLVIINAPRLVRWKRRLQRAG